MSFFGTKQMFNTFFAVHHQASAQVLNYDVLMSALSE